jgi:DNA-binding PadR family transcriptional regulator
VGPPSDSPDTPATSKGILTDIGAIGQDLVRGWVLLLLALRPCHGYDLVVSLRSHGINVPDGSYVYRLLRKLDRVGLLESWWDSSGRGGMARRVYTITDAGEAELCSYADAFANLLSRLEGYQAKYNSVKRTNRT